MLNLFDNYPEVSQSLMKRFGCEKNDIIIKKEFSEGKSGDTVLLICVKVAADPVATGDYILKIAHDENSLAQETSNTHTARGKMGNSHIIIPELRGFSLDSPAYYLYDFAGNDLIDSTKLSKLVPHKKADRLRDVSEQLLTTWNENLNFHEKTLRDILISWVGEQRLEQNSRLTQRVKNMITDELAPHFCYNNEVLPNPIFFLCNPESELTQDKALLNSVPYGQLHGDLNVNNIIIQQEGPRQGYRFYFIDFEQYRPNAPLLFDNAYLLLNVLLDEAEDARMSLIKWYGQISPFFNHLYAGETPPTENGGLGLFLLRAQEPVDAFFNKKQPKNKVNVKLQNLAAHVAAGLNFANKRGIIERKQVFAFLYAACAARELLLALGHNVPERGACPVLQTTGQVSDTMKTWKYLNGFSPDNRYILISACLGEDIEPDTIANLASIHWSAVIEVNAVLQNQISSDALSLFKKEQGYRYVLLPQEAEQQFERAPIWLHLCVPEEQTNKGMYYKRVLHDNLVCAIERTLSIRENEPLYILLHAPKIAPPVYNRLLEDIVAIAGENTQIHIVGMGARNIEIEPDAMINVMEADCALQALSGSVFSLMEHIYNKDEIRLPGIDGVRRMTPEMLANISNNMTIVHRGMANDQRDDGGEAFYLGNEATWNDIDGNRDVIRTDYDAVWRQDIQRKLDNLPSGASSVLELRHLPGGGGTTLAKRIAWDFCINFPTVWLSSLSEQTPERLKEIYNLCRKPVMVVVEANDGRITTDSISKLRRSLLPMGMRALFLCVSRIMNKPTKKNENILYLPDTTEMLMSVKEAESMLRRFRGKLDMNDVDDAMRIADLSNLTYNDANRGLRQPFFYGLYTYGKDYRGIPNFVEHNCEKINDNERNVLSILAMLTSYSQSVNLNEKEVALFMFPNRSPDEVKDAARDWLINNSLIVRRDGAFRISHPMIANEILRKTGFDMETDYGRNRMKELIILFITKLTRYYGPSSEHLNGMFHEVFTHREVIDENEMWKFSPLMTALNTRERCVAVMDYLQDAIPDNPHFCNHLARLYLYPIFWEQKGVFPDLAKAKFYAREAIRRSEAKSKNGESASIHYHTLGKIYTHECADVIRQKSRNGAHVSRAVKEMQSAYINACATFDDCIRRDSSGSGIIGKLELITRVLYEINKRYKMTIASILQKESKMVPTFSEMMAEAGDLITLYSNQINDASPEFRRACVRFFEVTGNLAAVERILSSSYGQTSISGNTRRALTTMLMFSGVSESVPFSYDRIDNAKLQRIFTLMDSNIKEGTVENRQDRIRWFETYRRLSQFSLKEAYTFLLAWPDADTDLYVCYNRYVISFLLYAKSVTIEFNEVRDNLFQCERLSKSAYDTNTSRSLDYCGFLGTPSDKDVFVPHLYHDVQARDRDERETRNKSYLDEHCCQYNGFIQSISESMATIAFSLENNSSRLFYAKAPIASTVELPDEGKSFRFHLGFSYSGLRAWDMISCEASEDVSHEDALEALTI